MDRTVGEVAKLAHVSVRTLHHYDRIGLLRPTARSDAGYRLYSPADLDALQELLLYRALGFGLEQIRRLRTDPQYDRRHALVSQRALLADRIDELEGVLALVEKTIAAYDEGIDMSEKEKFAGLGDFDPAQYDDEVRERWGDPAAYRESARRTSRYGKAEWTTMRAEADAINAELARLLDAGVPADDDRAAALVQRHRQMIDRWFYPCSPEMQRNLGEMYVDDPRFAATYDAVRPGLAVYLRDAIRAATAQPTR